MANLCIIPARGGSKRIPRKNVKDFLGKPIIAYSIEVALQSGLFDEVMVSTDDIEIAEVGKKYGAKVPFLRSSKNSNDYASTSDVINEVLVCYKENGIHFDFCCCLYPTAPFVTSDNLHEGFSKIQLDNLNTVFPVVEFSYPIFRSLKRENNKTTMFWPEYLNNRSQDLPKAYHDAGQWYWLNLKTFEGKLWTDQTHSIILEESRVQDIDSLSDWSLAELKYKYLQ
ncbi:pseudaminic acid cytidylyltransferase [Mongoliibacter ruber]|uniref:N-acylneuraminate cytidylyltransferase n=1 Tax=Mongoliibacter ruber TaxID=1750599 RepID=A0A2T0WG45_9BACT|nr:pseudaminic acid cytidylyltransferase [Mongoliibacter ruber]PRY85669.1 N-acylneuraminate cytidylyltransferase [Mongoliibacter ruber]